MGVQLNSQTIMQPSTLQEEQVAIQNTVQSLDGSLQLNYVKNKYQVKMQFQQLTISGYQQIMGIIKAGATVTYYNDTTAQAVSPLSFTGIADSTSYPYVRGASLLQQLDVTIRQV